MTEIHDALILHAEEDDTLVKQFHSDLLSNVKMADLNVIIYEEFAPDVQSHFESLEILFERCRYLLVVVTTRFKTDPLKKFLQGLALMDAITEEKIKGRLIPVWAETGAESLIHALRSFKGIRYMPRSDFTEEEKSTHFKQFKELFERGRKCFLSLQKA